MLSRAYSTLEIKSIDEDERVIEGIATSMGVDRMGDIVEPKGAEFKLPIPFLWQHNSREPIGEVFSARVTPDGIAIKARIAKVDEPGKLKDRLDEAWQSIKNKLVRGLSIGFSSIEHTHIDGTFGIRFIKWLWLELSAVTIPANGDASITSIKSIDASFFAAQHGAESDTSNTPQPVGHPVVRLTPPRQEKSMATLQEQLTSYKSTRDQKFQEKKALVVAAGESGLTLDAESSSKYEELDGQIKELDVHIKRIESLVGDQASDGAAAAAAANGGNAGSDPHAAHRAKAQATHAVSVKSNLPPGIEFARMVMCKTASWLDLQKGEFKTPLQYAQERYKDCGRISEFFTKATIPAALPTPTDGTWAGVLMDPTNLTSEFIEFLRPQTIIGKFGANGIPSLRRVPFNVRIIGATSGGDSYWVGAGQPKPVTKFDFAPTSLGFAKVASIAVLTDEVVRFSTPSAEMLVRDELAKAQIARIDIDLIDPTTSAVANVSPASITNGVTPLSPSGTSADAARADIARLIKTYLDADNTPSSLVLIMPESLALALAVQMNSLGQPEFPGLTMNGGRVLGLPVITSQYAANRSGSGNLVIAVNAGDVFLADDGVVTVDASREASIQMLDNPTNSASTGTPTTSVSMWQTNSVALRAERMINWAKRRSTAVAYMDDVNWGSIGSPA